MKQLMCPKCGCELWVELNPDESQCKNCGYIAEELKDYKEKEGCEE